MTGEPTGIRLMLPARTQLVENDAFATLKRALELEAYRFVQRQDGHEYSVTGLAAVTVPDHVRQGLIDGQGRVGNLVFGPTVGERPLAKLLSNLGEHLRVAGQFKFQGARLTHGEPLALS